jgi:hypothetical protein
MGMALLVISSVRGPILRMAKTLASRNSSSSDCESLESAGVAARAAGPILPSA